MKTLLSTLVLVFILFTMHAQQHQDLDEYLVNRKLRNFEIDMGFTEIDSVLLVHTDFVDSCYNVFFSELVNDFNSNSDFDELSAKLIYDHHLANAINGLGTGKPLPEGSGGGPKSLNGPCVNMDFESGDFTGWELTRGDVDGSGPYSYINEVVVGPSAYHQIFGGGVDPVCGIPRVNPTGGAFSARLGNGTGTGARAARLRQSFMVDPTNYMYRYSYAVVFQSPAGHTLNEQPYFTVRVFDSLGNSISCGEYSVIADAASAPDYQSTTHGGSTVLYKNWTTVFTNLQAYIGQNVTVEFTSGDCALGGHFGYAYIDASCGLDSLTTPNNTICQGDSTIITAPSGLGAYLWNTGETTQSITVHNGGIYTCQLTPFQGPACGIVLDIEIFEFPTPIADFNLPVASCISSPVVFNDLSSITNPGVISTWQWDFGDGVVTPASNGVIVGVSNTTGTYTNPSHVYATPGVYNVQLIVTSANGCQDSITYSTTVNAPPIVNAGPDQFVCSGTAVTLNGAGAVNYAWDNGITDGVPFVQGVGIITYTVTGTDANGCQNTDQVDVTVWALPNVNAGADQFVCEGTAVTLNGSGAVNYAWDNGVMNGVPFLQGVGMITYTVTGTDANGCQNTDQVDVTVWALPNVNAGADQQACLGSAITLSGSGALNYVWDHGVTDGIPFGQGVGTITYTVTGTDANGCQNADQVNVTIWALPNVNAGPDQVVCENVQVTLSGSGAVNYIWDNGVLDGVPFFPPIGTTLYTVIGTDVNGCSANDLVQVTVNPLPNVHAGPDQFICDGTAVTLNGTGAVNYAWDNGIMNGVPFVQGVGMITYTVTGTDANGCQNTDQVDVTVWALPNVHAGPDQVVCDGTPVTINGTGAVNYAWNNGALDGVPFVQPVGVVVYTVTGTDANGCQNTDQVQITVDAYPIPTAGADQVVCENTPITLFSNGGAQLTWNNGVHNGVPFVQPVGIVQYIVYDTTALGCAASDTVWVEVLPNPVISTSDVEICEGESVTLFGQGGVSYSWTNGVQNGVQFTPNQSGYYIVTGAGANGCTAQDTAYVTVNQAPYASFTIENFHLTTVDATTGFDNLSYGAVSWEWNFGDGSGLSNQFEPVHTFPNDEAGEYEITLTVYSAEGCPATAIKYIHVFQDYTIYVPNAFTPDGNGKNEIFKPVMEGFDEDKFTLYIFNRWGELVFESHDMTVGWDGKYAGQNFDTQDGVFSWKIIARIKDSADTKVFVGHVSLLK